MASILREIFRWNITPNNSNEEIDGLQGSHKRIENDEFKICHSGQLVNHETWTQIIKNDIIPPPMIRKKGCTPDCEKKKTWSIFWRIIASRDILENNWRMKRILDEPPWGTPVIKEWSNEMEDEKNKVEALQWFRWISVVMELRELGTPGKERWAIEPKNFDEPPE